MHEDGATFEVGHGLRHFRVPAKRAHIVDDLGARFNGCSGDVRFIRVNRDDGLGALLLDALNHRQDAFEFLLLADDFGRLAFLRWTGAGDLCSRARGFASDVDDVGALVEQMQGLCERLLGVEELTSVGEGVWRDVHDAHD